MTLLAELHVLIRNKKMLLIKLQIHFRLQAGKYSESLDLAKVALKMEERELGNRPTRMVELYYLMAEIYDEVIT